MIICCLLTLNKILTFGKIELCTHNQSWDMDILKSDCYCILCSIVPIHVNIKIKKKLLKNCCTSLIICCLATLNEILTGGKSQLFTHNQSWDMDILKSDCILCSIALMHVKINFEKLL